MENKREIVYLASLIQDLSNFIPGIEHSQILKTLRIDGSLKEDLVRLSIMGSEDIGNNVNANILTTARKYAKGINSEEQTGKSPKNENVKRLKNVFEGISLLQNWPQPAAYKSELPFGRLRISKEYFPIGSGGKDEDNSALIQDFEKELSQIQNLDIYGYGENLLYLLEKYASRIPVDDQTMSDISIFDQLKTKAAFALCLYDYMYDHKIDQVPGSDAKPFALIGGSLSGIQKFIYTIIAKGAAKNLKGRSFYLQLLVDNVVQLVLETLQLNSSNIIYSSGGSFYILSPNLSDLQARISSLENELSRKLFEYHGIDLYLSLDYSVFGETEIFCNYETDENIGNIWKGLSEKLGKKKGRRFSSLMKENFDLLFSPQKVSPEKKKDSITGDELGDEIEYLSKDTKENPVNAYTFKQIQLGAVLKQADFLIISRHPLSFINDSVYKIEPIGIGFHNYLISRDNFEKLKSEVKKFPHEIRILQFNRDNEVLNKIEGDRTINGRIWYGGNDYPVNEYNEPKTFEELCGIILDGPNNRILSRRRSGPEMSRLGVLRMDVDNLGSIFRKGLSPDKRSFSRYSALSRNLDWFFKSYLNVIWQKDYASLTQIIYSGGDDLFIVGKWDLLINMSNDIQQAFKAWVGNNLEITLSGGMASVGAKFPILKAAGFSENFERGAKDHSYGKTKKNSIAFISYTPIEDIQDIICAFDWDHEFPFVLKLKNEIKELLQIKQGGMSEGFTSAIYSLLQQAKIKMNHDGRYYPQVHRVTWLVAYQFRRSSDGKDERVKDFFSKWAKYVMLGSIENESGLQNSKYHSMQFLAIAARWAALENRSNTN